MHQLWAFVLLNKKEAHSGALFIDYPNLVYGNTAEFFLDKNQKQF